MAAHDETLPPLAPVTEADTINGATPRSGSTHPRHDPREWHRRGLRTPAELHELVAARINALPHATESAPADGDDTTDPTYGDFLREPTA